MFIHWWQWLPCKVLTSTSGAVLSSVACPKTLHRADQGNRTGDLSNSKTLALPLSHIMMLTEVMVHPFISIILKKNIKHAHKKDKYKLVYKTTVTFSRQPNPPLVFGLKDHAHTHTPIHSLVRCLSYHFQLSAWQLGCFGCRGLACRHSHRLSLWITPSHWCPHTRLCTLPSAPWELPLSTPNPRREPI